QYIYQAALGLLHAYERGLVHRDIKPHNLLLSKERVVKILDMGLARVAELPEDTNFGTLTHDGKVMGTPDFMSPEQSRNSRTADIRADIYSLGCTLYFLLTGSVPFPGGVTLTEKLLKHQLDEPAPVEELRSDVPVEIRQILYKMLAKSPDDRFQTPAELAAQIEPFAFGKPGTMSATTIPSGTAFSAARTVPIAKPVPANSAMADTISLAEQFRGVPPKLRYALYGGGALLLLLLVIWIWPRSGGSGRPSDALQALESSKIPAAERFGWQPKELVAVLGEHQGRNWSMSRSVAFSPDGTLVASAGGDQVVHFWDVKTLREQATQGSAGAPYSSVAYSPDGRYLVTGNIREGQVQTWEVGGSRPLATIAVKGVLAADPVFATDGNSVFIGHADTTRRTTALSSYQTTTGKLLTPLPHSQLPGTVRGLACATKNPVLAAAFAPGPKSEIRVWDLNQRRELPAPGTTGITGMITTLALSPDGRRVACGSSSGQLAVIDLNTQQSRLLQSDGKETLFSVTFSPDGSELAAGFRGRVKIWQLPGGKEKISFQTLFGDIWSLAYSPDGRTLATTGDDHAVRLWDAATGVERVPVRGPTMPLGFVAFTADQAGVVAGVAERGEADRVVETLKWWQLPDGRELGTFQNPRGQRVPGAFALVGDTVLMLTAEKLDERRYAPILTRWNLATGEKPRLPLAQTATGFTAMDTTERLAATIGAGDEQRRIALWNAETGTAIGSLDADEGSFMSVAIAPDSKRIATCNGAGVLELWDVAARKVIKNIDTPQSIYQMVFSPDGKRVAVLDETGTWRLWDLERNRLTVTGDQRLWAGSSLQFAPEGKTLATGGQNGRLEVWDLATGRSTGESWRLPGPIHGVAFSADGRYLATINGNGTVYILRRAK
ncbi:MAG: WD40 repeat domain-containing serine/threonine protein kinase, partial [Gemmataceae bacterium]